MAKFLSEDGLKTLWKQIIKTFSSRNEVEVLRNRVTKIEDNYVIADGDGSESGSNSTSATKSTTDDIVYCWGDSLTEGVGGWDSDNFIYEAYPNELTLPHINLGSRGEDIQAIAARQGSDPVILTFDVTLPASKDESVEIGYATKLYDKWTGEGLTTRSGETVKILGQSAAGVNPVTVGGIQCELYRDISHYDDGETKFKYYLRRLEDSAAPTILPLGTEIWTYAATHYRNGYAIFWCGANGRANSHQEYVQKIKQMVKYGNYKNYLVLLAREYIPMWVYDGDTWLGIKSLFTDDDGTCHLLYLPPRLAKEGYVLSGLGVQDVVTDNWETTDIILKNAPKLMWRSGTDKQAEASYDKLHFSTFGYRAIGRLANTALDEIIRKSNKAIPEPATSDAYGTYLYKLPRPYTFNGTNYLDTGIKLYQNGDSDDWCVCIAYNGVPKCVDGFPYVLCDCGKDGESQSLRIRQGAAGEGWTIFAGSGAIRADKSYSDTTWADILSESGITTIIISKNGTKYSIFVNGHKCYNAALGYGLKEGKYVPTTETLLFGARRHSNGTTINYKTSFNLKDVRIYNTAISDENIAKIHKEMIEGVNV